MAIDATRGLPSFSEMYTAYKNRGNLADVLKAGISGYTQGAESARKGRESMADIRFKEAQAKEAESKAGADPYKDYVDVRSLAPSLSKEQFEAVKLTAIPVGEKLLVKRSELSNVIPLVREQGTERRAQAAQEAAASRQGDLLTALTERQDKALAAQAATQAKAQQVQAANVTLQEAEKRPGLSKATDWLFNTERQKEIKQAQSVRKQALAGLRPGETAMINPKTNEIVAVMPEELQAALDQGYIHYNPKD